MKAFNLIVKIVVALAAVAGAVYVIATYGEQIVAWAKKILASLPCPNCYTFLCSMRAARWQSNYFTEHVRRDCLPDCCC